MFSVVSLTSILNRLLPEPHAGLLAGLLFGTKAALSTQLYHDLVVSGTLHIIALSGMNISIIMTLFADGLLWIVSRRIASVLTIFGIVWFVWFVGPSPSIVRAAIMGSLTLLATVWGRQNWGILSWILAVGGMLLLNIEWGADISFQLSALASLGIVLFGGQSESQRGVILQPLRRAIVDSLRLTLAAQIFTIPLILVHFHRVSLISPVPNLLIGWLISPLTIVGWITAVAGWVYLPIARVIALVDWVLLEYLLLVVRLSAAVPFASIGQ